MRLLSQNAMVTGLGRTGRFGWRTYLACSRCSLDVFITGTIRISRRLIDRTMEGIFDFVEQEPDLACDEF